MKILLTGASGAMGSALLQALQRTNIQVRAFCLPSKKEIRKVKKASPQAELFLGDICSYEDVYESIEGVDAVVHCSAILPPLADEKPKLCFAVNYGGTKNLVEALQARQMQACKLIFISSVAVYGDRQPPIHWGRVGDPVKSSYYDYYGASKIACERLLVESDLQWLILRQTGMLSKATLSHRSPLIFHQPLNNVLEYLSDRDSSRLLIAILQDPDSSVWRHIYNMGGGQALRLPSHKLYARAFGRLGFPDFTKIMDPSWFATQNFHGMYFLDSDTLQERYHYVQDGIEYVDHCMKLFVKGFDGWIRFILRFAPIRRLAEYIARTEMYKLCLKKHGTLHFQEENGMHKSVFFKSNKGLPPQEADHCRKQILDHGYDESKPKSELTLNDVQKAAIFRGGACLSQSMQKGDWRSPLEFTCAFGHHFTASPQLILEAGHFCPHCQKEQWEPSRIAKNNPFFAQVWWPLHSKEEESITVEKLVNKENYKN
ncbi:MAG: NAD(P)-dependent oxidoreductase [Eubacteriales bacterium]|nr:NAD(P)-dependent oxidoreductase [Eubacteriales bacterium]